MGPSAVFKIIIIIIIPFWPAWFCRVVWPGPPLRSALRVASLGPVSSCRELGDAPRGWAMGNRRRRGVRRRLSRFPVGAAGPRAPSQPLALRPPAAVPRGGFLTNRGPRVCGGESRIWRRRSPAAGGGSGCGAGTSRFFHGNASPDPSYFESGYFCCCCCFGEGGDRDGSRSLYICYKIFLQTELYTKMYCVHLHVYSGTSKNLNIKKKPENI